MYMQIYVYIDKCSMICVSNIAKLNIATNDQINTFCKVKSFEKLWQSYLFLILIIKHFYLFELHKVLLYF